MPQLFRRALHVRLPHAHRCSRVHQAHRQRQRERLGQGHLGSQRPGNELLAGLPRGRAVRRRVRHAHLQQETDRDRPPSAVCNGRLLCARREPRWGPPRGGRHHACAENSLHRRRAGIARLRGGIAPARVTPRQFSTIGLFPAVLPPMESRSTSSVLPTVSGKSR